MKYLYLTLLLALSYSMIAQNHSGKETPKKREKPVIPEITKPASARDPAHSIVLNPISKELLVEFEQTVIYVVDRKNDIQLRKQTAESFSHRFQPGAIIEVEIKKDSVLKLDPKEYFYRLIDFDKKYDSVKISFKTKEGNQFQRLDNTNNQWATQYTIDQYFKAKINGQIAYSDHTIKKVEMSFVYTPHNTTLTPYLGDIRVLYSENTTPKKIEQPPKNVPTPKKKKVSNHK